VRTNGRPVAASAAQLATIWVAASWGAPVGSIDRVNDNDPTGPRKDGLSASPSTRRQDFKLDGALCMLECRRP
jgi:hydroxybutyrate-dimer hydrolase